MPWIGSIRCLPERHNPDGSAYVQQSCFLARRFPACRPTALSGGAKFLSRGLPAATRIPYTAALASNRRGTQELPAGWETPTTTRCSTSPDCAKRCPHAPYSRAAFTWPKQVCRKRHSSTGDSRPAKGPTGRDHLARCPCSGVAGWLPELCGLEVNSHTRPVIRMARRYVIEAPTNYSGGFPPVPDLGRRSQSITEPIQAACCRPSTASAPPSATKDFGPKQMGTGADRWLWRLL